MLILKPLDLIPPLDAARNYKVEDRLPLLFLDEFDARTENFPLLLPLLWDGEITIGEHDLKLGKVVIVLAGSHPRLPDAMERARSMERERSISSELVPGASYPKFIDLLSRINGGVLTIPALSDPTHTWQRRADKICIAVSLLRERFGHSLRRVPLPLLRFIAQAEFRYGVRSIAHLIDLIPHNKGIHELRLKQLSLPLDKLHDLKKKQPCLSSDK